MNQRNSRSQIRQIKCPSYNGNSWSNYLMDDPAKYVRLVVLTLPLPVSWNGSEPSVIKPAAWCTHRTRWSIEAGKQCIRFSTARASTLHWSWRWQACRKAVNWKLPLVPLASLRAFALQGNHTCWPTWKKTSKASLRWILLRTGALLRRF